MTQVSNELSQRSATEILNKPPGVSQTFEAGGSYLMAGGRESARLASAAGASLYSRGVRGHAPPGKFFKIRVQNGSFLGILTTFKKDFYGLNIH